MSNWVDERANGFIPRYRIGRYGQQVSLPMVVTEDFSSPGKARAEAKTRAAAAEHDAKATGIDRLGGRATVAQVWELFKVEDAARSKADTAKTRVGLWNLHVAKRWGHRALSSVDAVEVQDWVDNTLVAGGQSPATTSKIVTVLSKVFQHAVFLKMWHYDPTRAGVKLPTVGKPKQKALSEAQTDALLEDLFENESHWLLFTLFCATTPIRPGEATGLFVRHLNTSKNMVWVEQQWDSRTNTLKPWCKGNRDPRWVPVAPDIMAELVENTKGLAPDEYVFATETGRPVCIERFNARVLKPAAVRAGLARSVAESKGISIYALRHTAITRMVEKLHNVHHRKVLAGWAGHSVRVLDEVYTKVGSEFAGDELAAMGGQLAKLRRTPANVTPMRRQSQ